jgi:tRNA (guanine-N7-)-methyltransferase
LTKKQSGTDLAAPIQGRPDWHGRRLGKKLRVGQKNLLENLLPCLQITPSHPDPHFEMTMSEKPDQVWLEIGFGGGEHLAAQAKAHPQTGFIGCEPFINGVAKLLTSIQACNLKNIRICDDDARPLLDVMDDESIDRAFILFSDPWPKQRHHKRRFIIRENLSRLARVLKDDAELRFASDHYGFVSWALEHLINHPAFTWNARSARDWRIPPQDWVATRYEEKALARQECPAYLLFNRLARDA